MLTPLCLLARKYGCDKFGAKHSYSRWYWDTFQDRRETIRKVVEIGVGEGASLYMWREFFPNATIYGADIEQRRVFCDERIMVYLCDQRKDADVQQLIQHTGPDIDLLIDDGSHNAIDQVDTFLAAMPLLAPGVGTQGGDIDALRKAVKSYSAPVLVNASRSIIYASSGADFAQAAHAAAEKLNNELK